MLITLFLVILIFIHCSLAVENQGCTPSSAQIESATKLARCRVHCIDAFSYRFSSDSSSVSKEKCLMDTDCWMCWDYCELFHTNFAQWGNMCNQKTLCFDGCRLACSVYSSISDPTNPYRSDIWSFPSNPTLDVDVKAGWLRLQWQNVVPLTAILPPLPHTLYVIFWHPSKNRPWLQLEQTLSTSYDTRHGDIVISGHEAEFLILAVTRDGLVATTSWDVDPVASTDQTTTAPATTEIGQIEEDDHKTKIRFVLAITGASIFTGTLFSIGLCLLYRMISNQRRRNSLSRANAIRFRALSKIRRRYTSASSRLALVTNMNVAKLEVPQESIRPQKSIEPPLIRYTAKPITCDQGHDRFRDLFKGTIFESPPADDRAKSGNHFQFDASFSFNV